MLDWDVVGQRVLVRTDRATYTTRRLVITAGPWVGTAVPALQPLVTVERQVVMWLTPTRPELFAAERFPVFYLHADEGSFYGVPVFRDLGFKIGRYHHLRQIVD